MHIYKSFGVSKLVHAISADNSKTIDYVKNSDIEDCKPGNTPKI